MQKGPSEREFFLLKVGGEISWSNLPDLGWFAVYDRPPSGHSNSTRLLVADKLSTLQEGIGRLIQERRVPADQMVFVETAASEALLRDPDRERQVWAVLQDVNAFKKRGDKDALRRIRASLDRKGGRPGPKRRDFAAWKIEALRGLSKGVRFVDALKDPARKSHPESARQELWQYCREFYRLCELAELDRPEHWQKPPVSEYFRDRFGPCISPRPGRCPRSLSPGQTQNLVTNSLRIMSSFP
jgi:hypothetical protein